MFAEWVAPVVPVVRVRVVTGRGKHSKAQGYSELQDEVKRLAKFHGFRVTESRKGAVEVWSDAGAAASTVAAASSDVSASSDAAASTAASASTVATNSAPPDATELEGAAGGDVPRPSPRLQRELATLLRMGGPHLKDHRLQLWILRTRLLQGNVRGQARAKLEEALAMHQQGSHAQAWARLQEAHAIMEASLAGGPPVTEEAPARFNERETGAMHRRAQARAMQEGPRAIVNASDPRRTLSRPGNDDQKAEARVLRDARLASNILNLATSSRGPPATHMHRRRPRSQSFGSCLRRRFW